MTLRPSVPPRRGARAFTLAEVLATMVLMGIVMPVVMRSISVALWASEHARNTAQAATLGEAKLMELVASGEAAMTGAGGDFGEEWPQYRWSCQSTTRDFSAIEIVLQVTWAERGIEQALTFSTVTYQTGTTTEALP